MGSIEVAAWIRIGVPDLLLDANAQGEDTRGDMKVATGTAVAGRVEVDGAALPEGSSLELVGMLRQREPWDSACITPSGRDWPRLLVSFHGDLGFVLQRYETEASWSDFLVEGDGFSDPREEIDLGGQAIERWPRELFVSERLLRRALDDFFLTGRRVPGLRWVRIDAFPRRVVSKRRRDRRA